MRENADPNCSKEEGNNFVGIRFKHRPGHRKRHRNSSVQDVDEAMYKWFCLARQRSVPISGPMIQEEARLVAEEMGHPGFKASNGWLSTFKKRHNIRQFTVSGEAADVEQETVEGWHE